MQIAWPYSVHEYPSISFISLSSMITKRLILCTFIASSTALFIIVIYYCYHYSVLLRVILFTRILSQWLVVAEWEKKKKKKTITEMFQLSQLLGSTLLIFIRDKSDVSVIGFSDDNHTGVEREHFWEW